MLFFTDIFFLSCPTNILGLTLKNGKNFGYINPLSNKIFLLSSQSLSLSYSFLFTYFIAGAFQSDALLVPEHCLFDHIHNQTKCWDFDQWNRTAASACQDRSMKVKSFAMLLPCGIDVFSGVEFVCCPMTKKGAWIFFLSYTKLFSLKYNNAHLCRNWTLSLI